MRDPISNRGGTAGKRCFRAVDSVLSVSKEASPLRGRESCKSYKWSSLQGHACQDDQVFLIVPLPAEMSLL